MTVFDCLDPVSRREGLDAATTAARGGRLVVLPTDTVYGIGADAFSPTAVRDLLAAKGRGPDMPVPVLIGSTATLAGLVVAVPPRARLLMDAFWPGGLSLILEHAPSLSWNLGDTRNTVMVRMPLHPVALELLRAVGPMAVSSANISGRPPATSAQQAQAQLSDSVSVFLDAGDSPVGVASTVVDLTGDVPLVRRVGAVSVEQLRAVLPEIEVPAGTTPDATPPVELGEPAAGGTTVDDTAAAGADATGADPVLEEAGAGRPPMIEADLDAADDTNDGSAAQDDPGDASPAGGGDQTSTGDGPAAGDVPPGAAVPLAADAGDGAPLADATVASGHESPQEAASEPSADDVDAIDGAPLADATVASGHASPQETASEPVADDDAIDGAPLADATVAARHASPQGAASEPSADDADAPSGPATGDSAGGRHARPDTDRF
nr:L-threonylcarbamoyladenylate synthase [Nakamurella deserti]